MRNNLSVGNYGLKSRFFSSFTKASDDFENSCNKTETSPGYQFLKSLEDSPFDGYKEVYSLARQISTIILHNSRSLEQVLGKFGKEFPRLTETEESNSLTLQMKNWLSFLQSQERSISRILKLDRPNLDNKKASGFFNKLQTVEQDLLLLEKELKQKNFGVKKLKSAIETLNKLNKHEDSYLSDASEPDTCLDSNNHSYPVSITHSRHTTCDLDGDPKKAIHCELQQKSILSYPKQEDSNKKSRDSFINHLMNDARSLKMHLNSLTEEILEKEQTLSKTQLELAKAKKEIEFLKQDDLVGKERIRTVNKKRNSAPANYVSSDRIRSSCHKSPICLMDHLQSLLSIQDYHQNYYDDFTQKLGSIHENTFSLCKNLLNSYVSLRYRLEANLELLTDLSDVQENIDSISFKKLTKRITKIDKKFRQSQNSLDNQHIKSSRINSVKKLLRCLKKHDNKWQQNNTKEMVLTQNNYESHIDLADKRNSGDLIGKLDNLDERLSKIYNSIARKKKPVLKSQKQTTKMNSARN